MCRRSATPASCTVPGAEPLSGGGLGNILHSGDSDVGIWVEKGHPSFLILKKLL